MRNTGIDCIFLFILMTAECLIANKQTNTPKNPLWKTTNNGTWKAIHSCCYRKTHFVHYTERVVVLFKNSFQRTASHQGMILKRSSRVQLGVYGLLGCTSDTLPSAQGALSFWAEHSRHRVCSHRHPQAARGVCWHCFPGLKAVFGLLFLLCKITNM